MNHLVWKLKRVQRMSPAEWAWRARASVQTVLESRGIGIAPQCVTPVQTSGKSWNASLPTQCNADPYVAKAKNLLGGKWQIFALNDLELGFPPNWNRHPKTGHLMPMGFGKGLNYRDETVVGGAIKYYWELNRHLELTVLAQAFHLTQDNRYLLGCRDFLDSWLVACPYPMGLNWTSSLEHAIRLVNWAISWHLLGKDLNRLFEGEQGDAFRQRWSNAIFQHCYFIVRGFSLHSSANNHLLGELMGLYVASTTWTHWPESAQWRMTAKSMLEEEALRQNAPDGVNREQATWYHHEVIDMMLICGLFGRANQDHFSSAYWSRLEAMLDFIASIMDVAGHVPMIGDADDARIVRFSEEPGFNVFQSQLATGAVLFERADFAKKAGNCDDKTRWLLGDGAQTMLVQLIAESPAGQEPCREFPEGGYYVLGDKFDTPEEVRMVVDAAPLGYLSIAAHGHADALAMNLSVSGKEILVDTGTYAYHTNQKWRNYFRSTSAHNTLRVDGLNQSQIGGSFMWMRMAQARCQHFSSSPVLDRFIGEHNGYRVLDDPVLHQREIEFDKATQRILVTDILECSAAHMIEIFWHFSEDCEVSVHDGRAMVRHDNVTLEMSMQETELRPLCIKGDEELPLGWISRGFDRKSPCCTVVWQGNITGSIKLQTAIKISY